MSEKDSKDYGPIWQIEQNIKNYEGQAVSFSQDAQRYMAKADEARRMAERYKIALEKLKDAGL